MSCRIAGYNLSMITDHLYSLALTGSIFVVFLLVWIYQWQKRPKNFPPGPRGLPLIGVLPFLGKYPERTFVKWSEKYGDVLSFRVGLKPVVVLNNYERIEQAFVKQSDQFSGRPSNSYFLNQLQEEHGVAMQNYGELWKEQRKFEMSTLRGFGLGKSSMEGKIIEEVAFLLEAVRKKDEAPFNIECLLRSTVSNVICKIIMGKHYDYDDPEFHDLQKFVLDFVDPTLNMIFVVFQLAPSFCKLPVLCGYSKILLDDAKLCHEILGRLIEQHQETLDEANPRDFIDAFLVEVSRNQNETYTMKQLKHAILELFFAGTETTSSTIYWALLCLLHYPEAQKRIRKEVMNAFGSNGQISMQRRLELPYTCAYMEEVMRFRSVAPVGVVHATTEDAELGEYIIPKDTTVIPNVWAVHNSEELWKDPEIFNPERFINENGEFVKSPHVIPFSIGPRFCLGEQLARMEYFTILASLVRSFEFLPDPKAGCLPEIVDGCNGLIFVPQPFEFVAKEI